MRRQVAQRVRVGVLAALWRRMFEQPTDTAMVPWVEGEKGIWQDAVREANALMPAAPKLELVAPRAQTVRHKRILAALILMTVPIAFVAALPSNLPTPSISRCTFADGTSVVGRCIFADEFNTGSLDTTVWNAADDWGGPIQLSVIPELACFRHEMVSVTGGNLKLDFVANARASCPQSWTASAYYTTNYGVNWPPGQATSYDIAVVDTKTFNFKYGHVAFRMKAAAGIGPGTTMALWGTDCQSPVGVIGEYLNGFFNHVGQCRFPESGSAEMDIVNFCNGNGNLNSSIYVDNGNGAPLVGTFFSRSYYGVLASNQVGTGRIFSPNPAMDPTDGFHVYELDWSPTSWSFTFDGVQVAREIPALPTWITNEPLFPMFWNADQVTVTAATLPQSVLVDYIRIWCPPTYPCEWSGAGAL